MDSYKKCIVAFLDILGFKNMIHTKAFDEIKNIFLSIIPQEHLTLALGRATDGDDDILGRYNEALSETRVHVMSDSIIIATPWGHPEALAVVIDICDVIQEQLYSLDTPVFLRGAIAEGDFYLDENLIFGNGLVDAYIAQENYAIYPRIIVSDDLMVGKRISIDEQDALPRDDDGYCYINTLERCFHCDTLEQLEDSNQYDKIKNCIDVELSGYADGRVREKYLWLRKELRRIERKLALKEGVLML